MVVASKLGPFVEHTFVAWVGLCFAINGKHAILPKFCWKGGYLHLWLYCNNEGMFKSLVQCLKVMNPRCNGNHSMVHSTPPPPTSPTTMTMFFGCYSENGHTHTTFFRCQFSMVGRLAKNILVLKPEKWISLAKLANPRSFINESIKLM